MEATETTQEAPQEPTQRVYSEEWYVAARAVVAWGVEAGLIRRPLIGKGKPKDDRERISCET